VTTGLRCENPGLPGSAPTTLPPVLLFVMGINEWREEQEWPLSRAVETELFLRADGQLTVEPPAVAEGTDTYRYDPTDPVITTGGAIFMSNEFRPARWTKPSSNRGRMCWSTAQSH
jgi:uncharacterized protein